MTNPQHPGSGGTQYNQQNKATRRGTVIASQGGSINIQQTLHAAKVRVWTGWAILVFFVLDVVFFFYGKSAYTGRAGDEGDLWRAGISLVLFLVTISLIRRWFRQRL